MNYPLKCQKVRTTCEILSTVSQQPVDLDFTLPDYCADIEKILKCTLTVKINNRNLSAGQLRIEGSSVIRILYCDSDKGALRCCEQTVPFSSSLVVNEQTNDCVILTDCKTEYINCRALTPRRLDIHGAFSLNVRVMSSTSNDFFTCEDSSDLQTKCGNISLCELSIFSQDDFSVSETATLSSKSNIESTVRSELQCTVADITPSGERMLIKGELTLRLLYVSDSKTGETEQFVYAFPFSQMVSKGSDDAEISDVRIDILNYDIAIKSEAVTDEPKITIDAKLCASLFGYKRTDCCYISDVYSTDYHTEAAFESCSACTDIMPRDLNIVSKNTVSLGDNAVSKIVDIFCEDISAQVNSVDNKLKLGGKLNVCILAVNSSGELIFVERSVDFLGEEVTDKSFSVASVVCAKVKSLSYRICENNEIELRFEIFVRAELKNSVAVRCLNSVDSVGEAEDKSKKSALTLYYALEGEKVWDIAKRYSTDYKSFREENSLDTEELESDTMLLIANK